jgi:AbrB family looped-hinge helix DNA binding protein
MLVKVDSRGRITIPKPVLRDARLKLGDKVEFRATAPAGYSWERCFERPTHDG